MKYFTPSADISGRQIPPPCRPHYEQLGEYRFPLTRKDVLYHFWYYLGIGDVNISKEGPKYVLHVGTWIAATGFRCLSLTSTDMWESAYRDLKSIAG